ncbi:hypothetical protein OSB04_000408 [Centaurea solstitialis]|uniref:PB1 domain-containing protein n=1 Tax=Centaurea solstitialis TaxID=347529 RepID=A0AA38WKN8_9ASTR|nr:hypothetical protein OSB04_000408 [Centaurea solstitialis]
MEDKVKLMCSYGGRIQPRSHSHHKQQQQLSYFYSGGHNKLLTVHRSIDFSSLLSKLHNLLDSDCNFQIQIKYKLPGAYDLEPLISVFDDDDHDHMMFEYDLLLRRRVSGAPARLRLFLFSPAAKPIATAALNPDFLFGFDKEYSFNYTVGPTTEEEEICDVVDVPENDVIVGPNSDPDPEVVFMRDSYVYRIGYREPGNAGGCCQAGLYYNRWYTDCGGK